ncbi:hypothetical protein Tco_0185114 [Tanacetum coccineum]
MDHKIRGDMQPSRFTCEGKDAPSLTAKIITILLVHRPLQRGLNKNAPVMLRNPVVASSQGWYPTYMDMGECDHQ